MILIDTIQYMVYKWRTLLDLTLEHCMITFEVLVIALAIALPLGLWMTRNERVAKLSLSTNGVIQTIPTMALFGFLIPISGVGNGTAVIALVLYAILPIVANTYAGVKGVDPGSVRAARGMGMTDMQVLLLVEVPLALRVILQGLRTAAVMVVGLVALAALIGGGGLGRMIYAGLATVRYEMILGASIPAALLALLVDKGVRVFGDLLTPRGIR